MKVRVATGFGMVLMVTYVPILKGRMGEFSAVAETPAASVPHVLPIFEVAPTDQGPIKDSYHFGISVRESLPAGLAIAVDVRHLSDPSGGPRRPLRDVADDLGVGYADYGIAHPRMIRVGRAPMPSLRYTVDDVWWIYRWPQEKLASPSMYDLCKALIAADHWAAAGADFSWGTGRSPRGQRASAGRATQ